MSSSPLNFHQLNSNQKTLLKLNGLVFAKEKSSIQLLTLKTDADAIFNLTDDDWTKISGLDIQYRSAVEESLRDCWNEFVTLWNEN